MLKLMSIDLEMGRYDYRLDVPAAVKNNLVDPVRFFVKNEPHLKEKLEAKRFRLISSVSLVDQLVERLLHSTMNNLEIEYWQRIPSKPGIGLTTDSDFARILDAFNQLRAATESDMSGYDTSVQYWEIIAEANIRLIMYKNNKNNVPKLFQNAVLARALLTGDSMYVFSDGTLWYNYDRPGMQLSGCYLTSSCNSRMRILAHNIVHRNDTDWPTAFAMGDDCVESYTDGAIQLYKELGHKVKFYEACPSYEMDINKFEFCSNVVVWTNSSYIKHYPSNVGKQLFHLLHQPKSRRNMLILQQFIDTIRYHPDNESIIHYLREDAEWGPIIPEKVEISQYLTCQSLLADKIKRMGAPRTILKQKKMLAGLRPTLIQVTKDGVQNKVVKVKRNPSKSAASQKNQTINKGWLGGITEIIHESKGHRGGKVPLNSVSERGREKFQVHGISHGIKVVGSAIMCELNSLGATAHIYQQVPIHPNCLNSWQLARLGETYQKFIFRKLRVEVVSQLPATQAGLHFAAVYQSNETVPNFQGMPLKKFLQNNDSFREKSAFRDNSVNMPKSVSLPSYNMMVNDYDTSVQGHIVVGSSGMAKDTYVGDIIVHYEVDMFNMTAPNLADTSGGDFSIPTVAGNKTAMYVSYTTSDVALYGYWRSRQGIWEITTLTDIPGAVTGVTYLAGSRLYLQVIQDTTTVVTIRFCDTYAHATEGAAIIQASGVFPTVETKFKGYWLNTPESLTTVGGFPLTVIKSPASRQQVRFHDDEDEEHYYNPEADLISERFGRIELDDAPNPLGTDPFSDPMAIALKNYYDLLHTKKREELAEASTFSRLNKSPAL